MTNNLSNDIKGALLIFLSAFMYSTLPILAKLAYRAGLNPSQALYLRYLFALLILIVYLKLLKHSTVLIISPLVIIQGLVLITGSLLYFNSLNYLPAGLATVIFFTYPAVVALLAIPVYKEKFVLRLFIGVVFAITGVGLISGIGQDNLALSLTGILLAGLSSFCYSIYSLISQKNITKSSPFALTATFALVAITVLSVLLNRELDFIVQLNIQQITLCLAMAVLNTVLSITLFLKGVGYIGASRAAIISTLEPVLTLFIAFLILDEILTPIEMLGSVFIFISMFLATGIKKQKKVKSRI